VEYDRIVGEVRPWFVIVENAGDASEWCDTVRSDLGKRGYATNTANISAASVGALHQRDRCFVVGVIADPDAHWQPTEPDDAEARRPQALGVENVSTGTAGRGRIPDWAGGTQLEPRLVRMANGVPGKVDRRRIQALGNAVVPQVGQVLGEIVHSLLGA
jgi:DNA (cytosine-5)-methyltransferase 1